MGFGRIRGLGHAFSKSVENAIPGLDEQRETHKLETELKERQNIERTRAQTKQIRALRNRYRGGGGLLNPRGVELNTASGLPTKLGV